MTDLIQYLAQPHIRIAPIARAVGVTPAYIKNAVNYPDKKKLSAEVQYRIIKHLAPVVIGDWYYCLTKEGNIRRIYCEAIKKAEYK